MSHKPPESSLKSLLWLWQKKLGQHNQEAGNTLIIAISLGVLLIGATSTMIFTSSRNRTNVASDEMSVRAQEVAELGITRTHDFVAKNNRLAEYPRALEDVNSLLGDDSLWTQDWSNISTSTVVEGVYSNTSSSNQTCTNVVNASSTSTASISDQIDSFQSGQAVSPNNLRQGGFELLGYVIRDTGDEVVASYQNLQDARQGKNPGETYAFGEMIVKSSVNPNANSVANLFVGSDSSRSQSQMKVRFPLIQSDPRSIELPGVWISDQSILSPTNSQIDATLLAPNCDNIGLNIIPGNNVILSKATFPPLPPEPEASNPRYYQLGDSSGNLTSSIILPRSTDRPMRTETVSQNGTDYEIQVYEYKVNSIDYNGGSTLKIIPGRKVILHLHGNISLGGSQTIENTCTNGTGYTCNTTTKVVTYTSSGDTSLYRNSNLVILGRKQRNASVDPVTEPNICLSGGAQIFGFVFAPDYAVGASGTGGGNGFIGAVWARLFNPPSTCGSNTGQVVAIQEIDDWDMLGMGEDFVPGNLPPRIGSVSQWQREGVN
ncbi:hypothetical protein A5482_002750 [Cyanobacterium sp. IPPAS B-1200]|uniref:hypothetical protein n=1 Tax=Cyanobacterium sp. IPPAS B-1200 TaxID=1562720 RepID=UPI000852601D|nr:hypothetical protein [Cyanobacterium sp. IPPAS B-1200]OEJ78958.1 hypothetical protein A5482_11715 [Cyanobacterium sp. IPPAS B-1200]